MVSLKLIWDKKTNANLRRAFSEKIATFCHRWWLSCAQPSSSFWRFLCLQYGLELEVVLIFLDSLCTNVLWMRKIKPYRIINGSCYAAPRARGGNNKAFYKLA